MAEKDDKVEELIKSGNAKFGAGDFEGTIEAFDKAINLNPADKSQLAEVYRDRGFTKNKLGRREEAIADWDEAIRLCDEAIEIDSENARAWHNRGAAKNGLSRFEEAIEDLDEAIRLDPKNASAWNNRGFAKNELDRHEEAIKAFDEAIRIDPKNASAWNNRGLAKDSLGRYKEAMKDVEKAVNLSPNSPEVRNNFAAIKAEKAAREAVEKRIGSLKADTKEVKDQAEKYRKSEEANRRLASREMKRLGITFSILIGGLIVLVLVSVILDALKITDVNIVSSPFSLLPWITIIVIITAPLVWTIRLRIVEANSAKIMQAEYRHLAYVEGRMLVYFPNQDADAGKEVRADYIKTTMTSSPSDKLLALQNKANVLSPSPVQSVIETIRNKARGNLPS